MYSLPCPLMRLLLYCSDSFWGTVARSEILCGESKLLGQTVKFPNVVKLNINTFGNAACPIKLVKLLYLNHSLDFYSLLTILLSSRV